MLALFHCGSPLRRRGYVTASNILSAAPDEVDDKDERHFVAVHRGRPYR